MHDPDPCMHLASPAEVSAEVIKGAEARIQQGLQLAAHQRAVFLCACGAQGHVSALTAMRPASPVCKECVCAVHGGPRCWPTFAQALAWAWQQVRMLLEEVVDLLVRGMQHDTCRLSANGRAGLFAGLPTLALRSRMSSMYVCVA